MVLASPHRTIIFSEQDEPEEPKLMTQLNWLNTDELDLVLVEGFRHEAFTKIELHRPSLGKPILANEDKHIIAIATDAAIDKTDLLTRELTYLELNDINAITDFIVHYSQL